MEPRTDFITPDTLMARLQAGEIVGALDYPKADRPLFWSSIAIVRDALPCVRQVWQTIGEQHVDGVRTRQMLFRICPRQRGFVDPTLAGLILLAAVCAGLLCGVPL
ncbi:MAG TPA: hypothetical protein PK752_03850 [Accumulibacter sp.]|uniref:hypothetical protein n=1 Tax=Accumulibacter sp. TaxID=2053492 RepID=UPI002CC1A8A0|nr:hypothetical protein [Accumulibacter sp.]HRD87382.1 hypothetical protein [Accumulibacter sp.]